MSVQLWIRYVQRPGNIVMRTGQKRRKFRTQLKDTATEAIQHKQYVSRIHLCREERGAASGEVLYHKIMILWYNTSPLAARPDTLKVHNCSITIMGKSLLYKKLPVSLYYVSLFLTLT